MAKRIKSVPAAFVVASGLSLAPRVVSDAWQGSYRVRRYSDGSVDVSGRYFASLESAQRWAHAQGFSIL